MPAFLPSPPIKGIARQIADWGFHRMKNRGVIVPLRMGAETKSSGVYRYIYTRHQLAENLVVYSSLKNYGAPARASPRRSRLPLFLFSRLLRLLVTSQEGPLQRRRTYPTFSPLLGIYHCQTPTGFDPHSFSGKRIGGPSRIRPALLQIMAPTGSILIVDTT